VVNVPSDNLETAHKKTTDSESVERVLVWRGRKLAAGLLDLGTTLTHLEPRIALADHVDSATSLDDLAIGMAVFQRTNATDNFHRIDLAGRIV